MSRRRFARLLPWNVTADKQTVSRWTFNVFPAIFPPFLSADGLSKCHAGCYASVRDGASLAEETSAILAASNTNVTPNEQQTPSIFIYLFFSQLITTRYQVLIGCLLWCSWTKISSHPFRCIFVRRVQVLFSYLIRSKLKSWRSEGISTWQAQRSPTMHCFDPVSAHYSHPFCMISILNHNIISDLHILTLYNTHTRTHTH